MTVDSYRWCSPGIPLIAEKFQGKSASSLKPHDKYNRVSETSQANERWGTESLSTWLVSDAQA